MGMSLFVCLYSCFNGYVPVCLSVFLLLWVCPYLFVCILAFMGMSLFVCLYSCFYGYVPICLSIVLLNRYVPICLSVLLLL